jgi:hypothetical protein
MRNAGTFEIKRSVGVGQKGARFNKIPAGKRHPQQQ